MIGAGYQIHCMTQLDLSHARDHSGAKMLTIGDTFPAFTAKTVEPNKKFADVSESTYGGWKVYFFWPKDFTFVCPTEIAAFGKLDKEFRDREAQILGVSTDSEFVHLAWRNSHKDLNELPFPMIADVKRELSSALGVLHKQEGVCLRATFIVDPENIIRFVAVNDLDVGRNPAEVLRVLDALQTDELCPCNWQKGQDTLHPAV